MRARVWNAPARPRLTALVVAVVLMTLLAVASVAVSGRPRREPTPDRPVFARRIVTLPGVVVTASPHSYAATSTHVRPR